MDDGGTSVFNITIFFVLLLMEAILYGFQKAISLMNEKEIERKAGEEKDKKSILLYEIVKRSTIYVNSIQLIITLIDLVMGYVYLPIWTSKFRGWLGQISILSNIGGTGIYILSVLLATICLVYILLTFGMLFPKKLAQRSPDAWAYRYIRFIQMLRTVLYPITGIVAKSANGMLMLLGFKHDDEPIDVTEEEIISMVNEGHEQGVLEASEAEMITNIFEFGEKEASDIMTHRNNIVAIDSSVAFKEALGQILQESYSRYPVYEENLDHIIGVLYLKDAMRVHTLDESINCEVGKVEGLLREAVFVPETKNIDDLFRSMQSDKNQMVVVMDEYGQTSGLVTMEDILEEIVGNIMDEYDDDENHIEEKGDNEYLMEGMTKLEDLEERFGIDFGDSEFETLNGFLISRLDRIPDEDENTEIQEYGYNFKIISVEKNVIQSVLVTKQPEENLEKQDKNEQEM